MHYDPTERGRMITATNNQTSHQLEDALSYLPRKRVVEYGRGQVIYDRYEASTALFLVLKGRVKVSTTIEDGAQIVTGIFCTDEFFGAGMLLGEHTAYREQAKALEISTLMSWTREEIEALIERQPGLGLALIQMLVGRCLDMEERLESLALDKIPKLVAVALMRLAKAKSGTREPDGAIRIPPLTHEVLSEYVGTSRELVTSQMNQLRRKGFLRYSRKVIQIYPEALTEHLRNEQAS